MDPEKIEIGEYYYVAAADPAETRLAAVIKVSSVRNIRPTKAFGKILNILKAPGMLTEGSFFTNLVKEKVSFKEVEKLRRKYEIREEDF